MATDSDFKTEEEIWLKNERAKPSDGSLGKSPHQIDKTDKNPNFFNVESRALYVRYLEAPNRSGS